MKLSKALCTLLAVTSIGLVGFSRPEPGSIAYLEQKKAEISTPQQAQELIDSLKYDFEDGNVNLKTGEVYHYEVDSPKITLKEGKAHCLEGALLAAYLLEDDGYGDLILSLFAENFIGHAVYTYQENGLWGAVGQSRVEYLKGRNPIYKTIKDLVNLKYNKLFYLHEYFSFKRIVITLP